MESLTVILQHAFVTDCNPFNIQDIATLQSVSKEVSLTIKMYVDGVEHVEQKIISKTFEDLNFCSAKVRLENVINVKCLLHYFIWIKRLYGSNDHSVKLTSVLNKFTHEHSKLIWSEPLKGLSKQKQIDTLDFILQFIDSQDLQQSVMLVFVLMSFICKVISNNKETIKDRKQNVFAHQRIRNIVFEKCKYSINRLREEITAYPFMFTDRVIRKIKEVKRQLSTLQ